MTSVPLQETEGNRWFSILEEFPEYLAMTTATPKVLKLLVRYDEIFVVPYEMLHISLYNVSSEIGYWIKW